MTSLSFTALVLFVFKTPSPLQPHMLLLVLGGFLVWQSWMIFFLTCSHNLFDFHEDLNYGRFYRKSMLDNNSWDKDKDPSGVAGHAYNPGTWEAKARRSWVQGQPRLHSESKASLCYKVRLYLGRGWVVSFNKHTGREKFKAFTTLVEQASKSLASKSVS